MPIAGLTDNTNQIKPEIKIFKGEPKTGNGSDTRPGKDLNELLRISTSNPVAQSIFRQDGRYGKQKPSGDFVARQVHIYFPYPKAADCFLTNMKGFDKSGLKIVCDRHTISKEVEILDIDGNKHRHIKSVQKECPLRNLPLGAKCPNDCKQTGQLLFLERLNFDKDMMFMGQCTTHSYEDLVRLTQKLSHWEEFFGGDLAHSPFPSPMTRFHIPFIIERVEVDIKRPVLTGKDQGYKRTGKKADGKTWALDIYPDPEWMVIFSAWQQWQSAQAMKGKLPKGAIAQLVGRDDLIEAEVEEVAPQALPPSPDERKILFKAINELRVKLALDKETLREICKGEYGVASASDMSTEQLIQLRDRLQILVEQNELAEEEF